METKHKKLKAAFFILLGMAAWVVPLAFIAFPHLPDFNWALLEPKGVIAAKEKKLMITALLIMLIAVVPAFVLLFLSIFKNHTKNQTSPEWGKGVQLLWWGLPSLVIAAISVIIFKSTHELDPYKPL